MKATGITRRIDDLGRIVIPKEIRRTMRIREGDPLEIFTDRDGTILLRKYSPIGELGEFALQYVEAVAQVSKCTVCVADRDSIVAAAGPKKKEYQGKEVNSELLQSMEKRENFMATRSDSRFCQVIEGDDPCFQQSIATIISQGDAIGAVILLTENEEFKFGEFEEKMAVCGSSFLGRQMEP